MSNKLNSKVVLEKTKKVAQACKGDACAICVKECLMLNEYMIAPKMFFTEVLKSQSIDPEIPFSCTQCGYCEKVCPESLKLYEVFDEMKKELQQASKSKAVLKSHYGVYFHQKMSQTKLVKGYEKGKYKRAFMPGCSLSAFSPHLVEETFKYLKAKDATIGSITSCCSKPLKDLGHQNAYSIQMSKFIDEISSKGIEEIIVGCQNCYDTLKKEYPALSIKSIWHIFETEGLPEVSNSASLSVDSYVIHDPCPVEKSPEIKKIIRRLVGTLGYKVENKEESIAKCCGLGAMAGVSNIKLSKKITAKRIKELAGERIINYCAACTEVMGQGNKESYHLLELIFDTPVAGKKNTLKKWMNRYQTKRRIT